MIIYKKSAFSYCCFVVCLVFFLWLVVLSSVNLLTVSNVFFDVQCCILCACNIHGIFSLKISNNTTNVRQVYRFYGFLSGICFFCQITVSVLSGPGPRISGSESPDSDLISATSAVQPAASVVVKISLVSSLA